MSISKRTDLVPIGEVHNTKAMSLKLVQARKQECRSRIKKAQQEIEDLKVGRIAELEYQILYAEAELKQLETHEKRIISSVDTQLK